MTIKPMTILAALLLSQGCGSSDDLNIVGQSDKEDLVGVIAADPGYVMALLPCPASTGCRSTTILDFAQVGINPAKVAVSIGRTPSELRELGTIDVRGGRIDPTQSANDDNTFIVEINEPADADIKDDGSLGYDPREKILVQMQLLDDSPATYEMTNCIHDLKPVDGSASPLILHRQQTIHAPTDVDVFSFDVVDELSFDTSIQYGKIIEVTRTGTQFSAKASTEAIYTCKSDGEELKLEVLRDQGSYLELGIDPDCKGQDDSGTVTIRVSDPEADIRSCPTYHLYAEVQASYL